MGRADRPHYWPKVQKRSRSGHDVLLQDDDDGCPRCWFAVLFGLSMDYEVFLLSRVREEHARHGDTSRAVSEAIARTARVITAAALIMVAVFSAFALSPEVFIKLIGLGLATAILVDATVVRMVLVPAVMQLLGERNWAAPRWLQRRPAPAPAPS